MLNISATKCNRCENVIIPPRDVCPYCGPESPELLRIEVEPIGEIISFTSLEQPPTGFQPPVVLALVRIDAGATILCLGSKDALEGTVIGRRVTISIDPSQRFVYGLL